MTLFFAQEGEGWEWSWVGILLLGDKWMTIGNPLLLALDCFSDLVALRVGRICTGIDACGIITGKREEG